MELAPNSNGFQYLFVKQRLRTHESAIPVDLAEKIQRSKGVSIVKG
jgi:hypothetical protein